MKTTDAAYLAGLIDGEGSIHRARHGNGAVTVNLRIVNCDQGVLKWAAKMLDGKLYVHPASKAHWKSGWQVWVGQNALERVLQEILPFMKIKRRQAELALELAALPVHTGGRGHPSKTTPARERICQQITDLNRRGQ